MTKITNIGHATVLIEMGGVKIMTDPVLRQRVGHLRRYNRAQAPSGKRPVDAVLISHLHWDHFDLPSLQLIGRDTRLVVPRGAGGFLLQRGFSRVQEVEIGTHVQVGEVDIEVTFADHSGSRPVFGPTADSLGFIMRHEKSIYFAGDTDLFPEMAGLDDRLDLALLPVWGWGPTLGTGHMDPLRAAQALALLQPKIAIPIHWGTFHPLGMGWLHPTFLSAPPKQFARHARKLAPRTRVEIVQPGQPFSWPA